jgi:hypothetical protein
MLRLGCLLVLVILIAIPAVAGQYLPWWGTLLVVLGELAVLVLAGPKLVKWGIVGFAKKMFMTKSQVLRGATLVVHDCREVPKPVAEEDPEFAAAEREAREKVEAIAGPQDAESDAEDADDEDDEEEPEEKPPARYVLVEFTLTPTATGGRMQHWDPDDLRLIPHGKKPASIDDDNKSDDSDEAHAHTMHLIADDGSATDDIGKIVGPARLRAVFGCPEVLRGAAKLRYYFEDIGRVELP